MEVLNYLDKLNWQSIVGMFAICWYFTYDLKQEMKKIGEDLKQQGKRTDKLYEMFIELLKDKSK